VIHYHLTINRVMQRAIWVGLCAALVSSGVAQAQAQYKIAVVDLQMLIKEYDKREQMYGELRAEVDKLQVDIDALSDKIEENKEKYDKNKDSMSDDEEFQLKTEIESDYADYQSELRKRQRIIDNKEEKVLKEVLRDIEKKIALVGSEENYHLILNAGGGTRGGVLYHSPTIDITPKVLEKLNSAL